MSWMDFNEYSLIEGAVRERVHDLRHDAESRAHPAVGAAGADRDRQLVDALRRCTSTATERLVATYGDRAYRLALHLTGNAQDAEELVQVAFRAVVRKIDTFSGRSAFRSWFYRIVVKAAGRTLPGRRRRSADRSVDRALSPFDEHGRHATAVADWTLSMGDPSTQTELGLVLTSAINQLPVDYRTAVILRDVEGLSNREIGEILGLSLTSVKSLVHRARLFLCKRLGESMVRVRGSDRNSTAPAHARVSAACGQ